MKIAVTTPTGHIGSKLANILLDRKSDVTLIARHPEKVKNLASRGAKVIAGEHSDPAVVEQAVRGADALFWLTPSEMTSHDPLGTARRMAEVGASIIRKHPELHVVQLSSAGAFLPSGTGPIVGLHDTEEKFRAVGKNIVALRPNEFMENVFFSLPTIIGQDSIYTSIPGATKAQFIATQHIAEIAEQIRLVTVPGDKLKEAMIQSGMSPEMAALLVEMEEAVPKIMGQFKGEQKRTGKVTFSQFAREVFAPAFKKASQTAA